MVQNLGKGDEGSLDAATASRVKDFQKTVIIAESLHRLLITWGSSEYEIELTVLEGLKDSFPELEKLLKPVEGLIERTHFKQTCVLSNHQHKIRRALIDKAIAKANNDRILCPDFESWSNEQLKEYI